MNVPTPAASASGHHEGLAGLLEVADELAGFFVEGLRSGGHPEIEALACPAVHVLTSTALTGGRPIFRAVAEVEQGAEPLVHHQDHAAAIAAVAPGRAPLGHELLATERHRPIATVASPHLDVRFVDKRHGLPGGQARSAALQAAELGSMWTTLRVPELLKR